MLRVSTEVRLHRVTVYIRRISTIAHQVITSVATSRPAERTQKVINHRERLWHRILPLLVQGRLAEREGNLWVVAEGVGVECMPCLVTAAGEAGGVVVANEIQTTEGEPRRSKAISSWRRRARHPEE